MDTDNIYFAYLATFSKVMSGHQIETADTAFPTSTVGELRPFTEGEMAAAALGAAHGRQALNTHPENCLKTKAEVVAKVQKLLG